MVYFEDGTLEFLYIRDLLKSITDRSASPKLLMNDLRVMPVANPRFEAKIVHDYSHLAQAKTPSTSLFLHKATRDS